MCTWRGPCTKPAVSQQGTGSNSRQLNQRYDAVCMVLQLVRARQQCSELQQQVQDGRAHREREGSDRGCISAKMHSLEYDLGSMRHSLQV